MLHLFASSVYKTKLQEANGSQNHGLSNVLRLKRQSEAIPVIAVVEISDRHHQKNGITIVIVVYFVKTFSHRQETGVVIDIVACFVVVRHQKKEIVESRMEATGQGAAYEWVESQSLWHAEDGQYVGLDA